MVGDKTVTTNGELEIANIIEEKFQLFLDNTVRKNSTYTYKNIPWKWGEKEGKWTIRDNRYGCVGFVRCFLAYWFNVNQFFKKLGGDLWEVLNGYVDYGLKDFIDGLGAIALEKRDKKTKEIIKVYYASIAGTYEKLKNDKILIPIEEEKGKIYKCSKKEVTGGKSKTFKIGEEEINTAKEKIKVGIQSSPYCSEEDAEKVNDLKNKWEENIQKGFLEAAESFLDAAKADNEKYEWYGPNIGEIVKEIDDINEGINNLNKKIQKLTPYNDKKLEKSLKKLEKKIKYLESIMEDNKLWTCLRIVIFGFKFDPSKLNDFNVFNERIEGGSHWGLYVKRAGKDAKDEKTVPNEADESNFIWRLAADGFGASVGEEEINNANIPSIKFVNFQLDSELLLLKTTMPPQIFDLMQQRTHRDLQQEWKGIRENFFTTSERYKFNQEYVWEGPNIRKIVDKIKKINKNIQQVSVDDYENLKKLMDRELSWGCRKRKNGDGKTIWDIWTKDEKTTWRFEKISPGRMKEILNGRISIWKLKKLSDDGKAPQDVSSPMCKNPPADFQAPVNSGL